MTGGTKAKAKARRAVSSDEDNRIGSAVLSTEE